MFDKKILVPYIVLGFAREFHELYLWYLKKGCDMMAWKSVYGERARERERERERSREREI